MTAGAEGARTVGKKADVRAECHFAGTGTAWGAYGKIGSSIMSTAQEECGQHESASDADVVRLGAQVRQLRKHGIYAVVGILVLMGISVGYCLWKGTEAPPLADPYQIIQNEQKETIRLDRRTGDYWLLEDGIPVRFGTGTPVFTLDLLPAKEYVWDKTADGCKMRVRLRYASELAYCVWHIWPSTEFKQRFASSAFQRQYTAVDFLDEKGIRLASADGLGSLFSWVQENDQQVLECQLPVKCSATEFKHINTCRVRY